MREDRMIATSINICRASYGKELRVEQEPPARSRGWVLSGESAKRRGAIAIVRMVKKSKEEGMPEGWKTRRGVNRMRSNKI
jgi:hypothetical protein